MNFSLKRMVSTFSVSLAHNPHSGRKPVISDEKEKENINFNLCLLYKIIYDLQIFNILIQFQQFVFHIVEENTPDLLILP